MAKVTVEQRYGPTSGALSGVLGIVVCVVVAVGLPVAQHDVLATRWALGAGAIAVLLWSFMLRPRIIVRPEMLELRNPLSTWLVPLVCVKVVQVRALTRIRTASGGSYDAVAVGRTIRSMTGRARKSSVIGLGGMGSRVDLAPEPPSAKRYGGTVGPDGIADLMVDQILAAAARAKDAGATELPVRRVWAVPELVLVGALVFALALTWLI